MSHDIETALEMATVLDRFGIDHDGDGETRLDQCPACSHKSRRGTASVNLDEGVGRCFACGATWNALSLLADLSQLQGADLHDLAVEIVGDITGPDAKRKLEENLAQRAERRAIASSKRAAAIAAMPAMWNALYNRHAGGETYLRHERGVDAFALRDCGDLLRYNAKGEPAVALRDLKTSAIVGVQSRRILPGEPKSPMVKGSKAHGSALASQLSSLDPNGVDVAVIVEGLTDTLAAHLAFSGCAIFGAPGWGQLESIAVAIARRVVECRGWLLIVPHDDDQGADGAVAAVRAAVAAGLELDKSIHIVDLGTHKDLADAWRSGWRWSWPS